MARLPRRVLPGIPHHITQRGNRRERAFFEDGDYALNLDLLDQGASRTGSRSGQARAGGKGEARSLVIPCPIAPNSARR